MILHQHHHYYNYLNLPSEVIKDAGNKVMYIYDATGSKLCRRSTTGGTTTSRYYTGLMEYNGTTLDIIHNEEGLAYYTLVNGIPVYEYEYYLKDHLGNIRNAFTISNNAAVSSQYTEYYPFGMVSVSGTSGSSHNDYLYNGKELQRDLGMEWYDYGARFYDPQIGRWSVIDNKAEKYFTVSPYVYAINNPIMFVDEDGNDIYVWYTVEGQKEMQLWVFNGSNGADAPEGYARSFVEAYNYDVGNGGGDNLKEAATNPELKISLRESDVYNGDITTHVYGDQYGARVYWNPDEGTLSEDGKLISSPATDLEHEFDHAVDAAKHPREHDIRYETSDSKYGDAEERRVFTGSDAKTGHRNKEYPEGQKMNSHNGTRVKVDGGPTSTKVNKMEPIKLHNAIPYNYSMERKKHVDNINKSIK